MSLRRNLLAGAAAALGTLAVLAVADAASADPDPAGPEGGETIELAHPVVPGQDGGEPSDADDADDAPAGAPDGGVLYLTGCASCHGADGSGVGDWPSIRSSGAAAADFMLRTGRMPLANPTPQAPAKPPAYDDAEIEAIVEHVATLGGGPEIPEVDPDAGDIAEGGELYRANCAACHNAAGIGGALSGGELAPSLHHTAPTQIAEAIRVGPGQMPLFSEATLTEHEVDSIIAYIEYLKEPETPGGAALGGAGPLSEGFVAVLFGLGVLIVASRWITREHGDHDPVIAATGGDDEGPDGAPGGDDEQEASHA
ncbi:MAG: c-type cytochrome [Actinomycetota bacterium]|nr:c-type cytochrome [Actinomycetota bacterium]